MIADAPDAALDRLLAFLRDSRGFNFGAYKRPSLERRLRVRMDAVGTPDYTAYEDYLEANPGEFALLFDALLVNVTDFFRDPPVWEALRTQGIPALLAAKPGDETIRVWSAGCAGGQEPYTIAMVLAEALGMGVFRQRVKIYATDLDEDALDQARQATYSERQVASVPEALRERYFEPAERDYAVVGELRRAVIFGRNDLLRDAPISRLDLLACRNTLMYFNVEAQARVLRHFHFALDPAGLLVLGRAETMLSQRDLFEPVEVSNRLLRKVAPIGAPAEFRRLGWSPESFGAADGTGDPTARDAALDLVVAPLVVITSAGRLEYANRAARTSLGVRATDVGRPVDEVTALERPRELRAVMRQAAGEQRRVSAGRVTLATPDGETRVFDVAASSLPGEEGSSGVVVTFEDATRVARLEEEAEADRRDLELAYEELQSTIDELETTNEELQSSNEELQTTNEELQSTNEELETMNEELRTTNDQLERSNRNLRTRTRELDEANDFLERLVGSLGLGLTVVDRDHRVLLWNDRAEELWGLRRNEALTQPLVALDIGLPVEALAPAVRDALAGWAQDAHASLEATDRRGRRIMVDTTVRPLLAQDGEAPAVRGAIVLMRDRPADGGANGGADGAGGPAEADADGAPPPA